jgi:hypothetical protein
LVDGQDEQKDPRNETRRGQIVVDGVCWGKLQRFILFEEGPMIVDESRNACVD